MTPQEVKVWNWLREGVVPVGWHFRRQVPIDRFVVDFACLKAMLIVEIDGDQHGRDPARLAADEARDAALGGYGHRVLRFTNADVDCRKRVVTDTVMAALQSSLIDPHPAASRPPSP